MCGINGFSWSDSSLLETMNATTAHRGPDFAGVFTDQQISLGHRLLSIRSDTTLSQQPYSLSDRYQLAYNGQIYNTAWLVEHFDLQLNPASSDLDTHVLYKLIEKLGLDFVQYIHGMFAIALYDRQTGMVHLYRDSSGQKNLYYYHHDGRLIFSSEIKAIASHDINRSVDPVAVDVACTLGFIPGNKTLFQHINKLEPGTAAHYNLQDTSLSITPFDTKPLPYYNGDLQHVMQTVVSEHLLSKTAVSINLSGGLDSSILAYEIAAQGGKIDSFTTSFAVDEGNYNEDAELAARLAADFGFNHTEIRITPESYLEHLVASFETIEEPNYNISLPVYLQTAQTEGTAGAGLRVVLSGDGGDEVFGGYPHYQRLLTMDQQRKKISWLGYSTYKALRNKTWVNYADPTQRWLSLRNLGRQANHNHSLGQVAAYLRQTNAGLLRNPAHDPSIVYDCMLADRAFWMAGENFVRSDKLYMSQSMEMRCPLSYPAFRMAMDSRLEDTDFFSGKDNKIRLREYAEGRLPDYITHRPNKTGWRAPVAVWYDQRFKAKFLEIINSRVGRGSLVDWQAVADRIQASDQWPGKAIHLYLSLAVLANLYNLDI